MSTSRTPELLPTPLPQLQTACMRNLDAQRTWVTTLALRIGESYVGVRANSRATAETLETAFSAARAPEADALVSANFSVEIALSAAQKGQRGLPLVYRDAEIAARRREPADLLLDLVELLDATAYPRSVDHVAVRATVLVGQSAGAVLLPTQWHRPLLMRQRELASSGLDLLPATVHQLEHVGDTGSILVDSAVAPGRRRARPAYRPVRVWALRVREEERRDLRAAEGVQAAFPTVANLANLGPESTLRQLAQLAEGIRFIGLPAEWGSNRVETARTLAALRP